MKAKEQIRNMVLFGVSVQDIVVDPSLSEAFAEEGITSLGDLVQHEVERVLRKKASIKNLGMSPRLEQRLIRSGYDTIEKFLGLSSEFSIHTKVRLVGAKSFPEINMYRERLGAPPLTRN